MKKKKLKIFLIIFVVIAVLIAAAIGARIYIQRSKSVGVTSVSNYASTGTDNSSQYGQITAGGVEQYQLDKSLLLEAVYVSEGSTVTKGQALYKYDSTQSELDTKNKDIQRQIADNDLAKAQKRLAYLKTVTPYVREYDCLETITDKTSPSISGSSSGTKENDPITYIINQDTTITKEFLNAAVSTNTYYKFIIIYQDKNNDYKDANLGYIILVKDKDNHVSITSDDYKFAPNISDPINNKINITLNDKTKTIFKQTNIASSVDLVTWTDDEKLTKEGLAKAITEQEEKIKDLDIADQQANLDYRKALLTEKDGVVKALSDGIVTKVGDKDNLTDGESFIEIQSTTNYQITTSINEFDLAKYHVGDTFEMTMWSNNMTYTGTITSISDYPEDMTYTGDSVSQLQSTYELTGELDCDDTLSTWDGGQILFNTSDDDVLFTLPTYFVRKDNNNKYYCLVVGKNDRLEKHYVEVGKITDYGSSIEILSGLSLDDEIAFPYGSSAIVGAKADRNAEVLSW